MKNNAPKFCGIECLSLLCSCVFVLMISVASAQAAATGFLYALNDAAAGNKIYGYSVNEGTGVLTAISGSPIATGGNGGGAGISERVVVDKLNGRLYVINGGSNTISAYSINPTTGALTPLSFSPITLDAGEWSAVAVHPSGSPLVIGNSVGNLASFNITATMATAAAGSPFTTGTASPYSIAFSQDGNFIYTGGNTNTNFAGFSVNASTGVLIALTGSPFDTTANNPMCYTTDSAGRIFMANFSANQLRAFTTSGGIPTAATGNPFVSGLTDTVHGVLHPRGFYMVADRGSNLVGVYSITNSGAATTLAAVSGSPFTTGGIYTDVLALNQNGTFLFAANGLSRNLTSFSVNTTTGALSAPVMQTGNTLGVAGVITGLAYMPPMVLPPAAGLLYVLNDAVAGNKIFGFAVNEASGALTLLNGFPIATGGNGDWAGVSERVVVDKLNGRIYVINGGSNTISAYSINPTTGTLTALSFSPITLGAGGWVAVAVHPSGSPLVIGDNTGNLASFNITATTATAAIGSPFTTGTARPYSIAFSQDGNFIYTGGDTNTNFAGFSVNASTGVLTALAGSPFDTTANNPMCYATDSAGRIFMANLGDNQLRAFTTSGGIPTAVTGNPFISGLAEAIHGVLHPRGFYMVADRGGNQVGVYSITNSGAATTLAAVSGSPFVTGGTFTDALALNQNGTFLFAANGSSRNLTSFSVNTTTGALSAPITQPGNSLGASGLLTGMVYVAQPATIAFLSGPTATPNPASVGETVSFTAAATGGFGALTLTWNFGDGTTGTGATVTHAYTTAGVFTATVTVTDILGVHTSGAVAVTIVGAIVGTGIDTDGDGFSDSFETAVGTNPNNAADTPTGSLATASVVKTLSVLKALIKLNFAKPGLNDAIGLSGGLLVPDGFSVSGKKVFVVIGGVLKSFVLGVKGASPKGNDMFVINVKSSKGVTPLQVSKFVMKLTKGNFAATLAAAGLVNATTSTTVTVPVTVIFNGEILKKTLSQNYKAVAGKGGAMK
ncbi:MAG: beta-propeller fold lactonase family protein [Planctomycetota bacterium]